MKQIIWAGIGLVLGGVAGFAIGIFLYPYIFLADLVATETLAPQTGRELIASGCAHHDAADILAAHDGGTVNGGRSQSIPDVGIFLTAPG